MTNPLLQLSLDKSYLDPQLYTAYITFRDRRGLGEFCISDSSLEGMRFGGSQHCQFDFGSFYPTNTPAWSGCWPVGTGGQLTDACGIGNPVRFSRQEFDLRFKWIWNMDVAQAAAHRSPFCSFPRIDMTSTCHFLGSFSPSDQGLFRRILNGSSQTHAEIWQWSESGSLFCHFCGEQDSIWHRFWECSHTRDLRLSLPPGFLDLLPSLPQDQSLYNSPNSVSH